MAKSCKTLHVWCFKASICNRFSGSPIPRQVFPESEWISFDHLGLGAREKTPWFFFFPYYLLINYGLEF
jgi:hypothetical protein